MDHLGTFLRVTVVAVVIAVIVLLVLSTRTAMRRAQKLRARHRDSLRLLANELDDRYDLVPALIAASAGAGVERSRISPVVGARTLAIAMRDGPPAGLALIAGAFRNAAPDLRQYRRPRAPGVRSERHIR